MNPIPWYKSNVLRGLLVSLVALALQKAGLADTVPSGEIVDGALTLLQLGAALFAGYARIASKVQPVVMSAKNAEPPSMDAHPLATILVIFMVASFLTSAAALAVPPVVTISIAPNVGPAGYQANLAWTATNAATCQATGDWSGTRPVNSAISLTISKDSVFGITCTGNDGTVTTMVVPPATNTDGTPYTDNAGYNIYRGPTADSVAKVKSLAPTELPWKDVGLAPGTYYYKATTVNKSRSVESGQTSAMPFPVVVKGSQTSASTSAKVTAPGTTPNPPTMTVVSVDVTTNVNITTSSEPAPAQ